MAIWGGKVEGLEEGYIPGLKKGSLLQAVSPPSRRCPCFQIGAHLCSPTFLPPRGTGSCAGGKALPHYTATQGSLASSSAWKETAQLLEELTFGAREKAITCIEHLLHAWPQVTPLETTISDAFHMGVALPRETSKGKQGGEWLHSPMSFASPSPQWADLNSGHQAENKIQGEESSPSCNNQLCPALSQPS